MIKQVRFHTWGSGPKGYWRDVSSMARFVAAALQYRLPRCNGRNSRVSTIRVDQHKEKFGAVRIYCSLAHPAEVNEKWDEEGNTGEPTLDFIHRCMISDARHYRLVYMDMVALVPHLRDALCSAADYGVLLCDDADSIDKEIMPHVRKNGDFYLKTFHADDMDQLRVFFEKVYVR